MKKLTCMLTSALIFSLSALAQDHYVEVVVNDTLMVEPQKWTLFINIEKRYHYSATSDTTVTIVDTTGVTNAPTVNWGSEKESTSVDEVKALAKKFKGTLVNDAATNRAFMGRRSDEDNDYFNVEFTSRKSLEGFLEAIASLEDVEYTITDTHHRDLQKFHNNLDAKLMNVAKEKATRLAQLSGRKAGPVILVSEATQSETNTLQDLIEMVIKFSSREGKGMAMAYLFPDQIKVEKSLKVRFALQ